MSVLLSDMRTTYLLDTGTPGRYRDFPNYVGAVLAAYDHALKGGTVTVVQVDGDGNDLTFTPLCVLAPPSAPPPGGTHE